MSIAIDPKAGTHFIGKIFVSPHACDRAVEHFGVERAKAPMYVMDLLRKSSLISEHVIDEDGKPGRMFAYRRTVFIVHPSESTVYTLYPQHKANEIIRNPIERLIQRAVKAAERKEKREAKRINVRKAELAVERAEAELRCIKSESNRVIAEMNARVNEIDVELRNLERELFEIKREKTNLMKSVVAYV
ncbi:hypothetical protein [Paenibacillus polymyxa]|uniref:hypothetical protein n=1 Tax=Paenibacillus polymyxa TaxID=1406 RepID=UPI0018690F1C|nr:hypothetical protein [Paenibacillus polymyxa]MBE3649150.1 hypothetical protein [Paenibacillus polymyxa]